MNASLEDPIMAGFVARLDEINALADGSPGFVWRLQTEAGNATYLRPYEDDRILFNFSIWETIEALRTFQPDVVHLHEPLSPGPNHAALVGTTIPAVGTFHSARAGRNGWYETFRPA